MYKQVPALVQNYVALFLFKIEWHCTTIPENLKRGRFGQPKLWLIWNQKVFEHVVFSEGCKSRVVGCGPDCWSIPHTVCSGGQCNCGPGYLPHTGILLPIIQSWTNKLVHVFALLGSAGKLSMCLSAVSNSSLQSDQASSGNDAINIHYYPGTVHCISDIQQYSGRQLKLCMSFVLIILTSKHFWLL